MPTKKKKRPFAALKLIYEMAEEMSYAAHWGAFDLETGDYLGKSDEVVHALETVGKWLGLPPRKD